MKKETYCRIAEKALGYYVKAGIALTEHEIENLEVADFGLGDVERTGLELVVYINCDKYCAKEMVLLPGQTCPEHMHVTVGEQQGKQETFRCRYGKVYLYTDGEAVDLEMAEGYVTRLALDANNEVIGYEFVSLGKMTDFIKKGMEPNEAYAKAMGHYGRFTAEQGAVKFIDPRKE